MRLIDANLAMRKIREYMEDYPNATARLAACRACLSILGDKQQVPTIDPESLRPRGKWILVPPTVPFATYKCNLCGEEIIYAWAKFCPHCGAKMEGADER